MTLQNSHTLIVLVGPTAVGKTELAIRLAESLGTDIISADSRQCYREMSIGTAKPTPEERSRVHHYFVDEFPVTEYITAARFEHLALSYLNEIFRKADIAVVTGGTGLYIKALCEGLDEMPEVDAGIARQVQQRYEQDGLPWLRQAVQTEDPLFFARGETQNPARLIRALVFIRSTGSSITAFRKGQKKKRPFRIVKAALDLPREMLYNRINQRTDLMMDRGLLEEVRSLLPHRHLKNLNTVGYAELFDYLDGNCTLPEAVEKIKQHTRNYAKRQLTWFRNNEDYYWFRADDPELLPKLLALLQDDQH